MFVQAIGIFAIAAVGGPTTWLHVRNTVGGRTEHAQERFRMHRASAYFDVVGLLQHAVLLHPELRQLQDQVLKSQTGSFTLKFCFKSQLVSKRALVFNFRSL